MSGIRIVTSTLLALAVVTTSPATVTAAEVDASLRAELERIAHRRIFFGHQSVGENLLAGIKRLASNAGVSIRVTEVKAAKEVMPATLGHSFVSRNGEPLQKLESFEHAMGQQTTGLDIAMVKFCYVDITPETDAKALFSSYRATIDRLRAKNPDTTFVHVTAPLTSEQSGPKELLKQILGRGAAVNNLRREEYNTLLRQAYLGREPVFDLARVESTAMDGAAVTVKWKGSIAPAMSPAYTDDGGHLNIAGQTRAARELISVLAAIPNRPATGAQTR